MNFSTILSYVVSIIGLGLIIFIHELGHFLLAKRNGVMVEEFSLGMGPRLLSVQKGETRYSLKAIPFGGSCQMLGEDEAMFPDKEDEGTGAEDDRSFLSKSVWARFSILFAGPFFNFILAFVLALVVLGVAGVDLPQISDVMEGYPAEEAGLQAGDTIVSLDGKKMTVYRDVLMHLQFENTGEALEIVYERDGEQYETVLVPRWDETDGKYYMGIYGSPSYRTQVSFLETIRYSFHEVWYYVEMTFKSLGMLFSGQVSLNDMSGPVGITNTMSETVQQASKDGFLYIMLNLFNIIILISANLGVMNLLPIPALDGGRILFLVFEMMRGKPVDRQKEGLVNMIGFVLLMLLMVVVLFNDVRRLF